MKRDKEAFAARLRESMTPPEIALAARLWSRAVWNFEPQVVVLGWIVDFWLETPALAVEVDGAAFHDPEADAFRDSRMLAAGISVVRCPASDVLSSPELVAERVEREAWRLYAGGAPRVTSWWGATDNRPGGLATIHEGLRDVFGAMLRSPTPTPKTARNFVERRPS